MKKLIPFIAILGLTIAGQVKETIQTSPILKPGIVYQDQPPHKYQKYTWLKMHIFNINDGGVAKGQPRGSQKAVSE